MGRYNELPYTSLKRFCNPRGFDFKTTEELIHDNEIIGQDRAVKSMEFGLQVKNSQYNIFVVGLKGTGKTSYATRVVQDKAKTENVPDDWCYVYNFDNPSRPIALNMPPGMGKIFCQDMDLLIQDLTTEIPKAFNGEDYDRRKTEIVKKYQGERDNLLEELTSFGKKNGFMMKSTSSGFAFAPIIDGEVISDKDYDQLEDSIKDEIEKRAEEVQMRALEILRRIKASERQAKKKILELDHTIALFVLKPFMDELMDKYKGHKKILDYLEAVQKDIIENIYDFDLAEEEQSRGGEKKREEA